MISNHKRLRYACYTSSASMSIVGNLSPLLFLTFHSLYDISYSLLGLLVLINFCTQLGIDLVFSFFSHKFNISKTVKVMPLLTVLGLGIYALWPYLFPDSVYVGLLLGTIVFSASAGLSEVLLSPIIAALPAKDPDREMSKLHSVYAWGVVFVIIVATVFLFSFGNKNWQPLALLFMIIPTISAILFFGTEIPDISSSGEKGSPVRELLSNNSLWLCFFAIFLGGAAECTMAQWGSGYIELAFGIPKIWGDIFGMALFAAMLGLGRSLYAKIGKNIGRVLFLGAIGATVCYLTAAVSSIPIVGLFACAFTGFCVSVMWPGCLVVASDRFPKGGVFIYAMMAAGGDLGASIVPQLIGITTDTVSAIPFTSNLAKSFGMFPEQFGMRLGMLMGMLFPLVGIFLYFRIMRSRNKK